MHNRLLSGMLLLLLTSLAVGVANAEMNVATPDLIEQGIREYRQENFEEAAALLATARKQGPESGLAAYYLGLAYKQTGELPKARESLRQAANSQPPVLDAYLELGELAYTQEEYGEALDWTKQAVAKGIKPGHTAFLAGLINAKQGDTDGALAAFAQAKSKAPELTQAVDLQRAVLLAGSRRFGEANEALRAVVLIDPTSDLATYARDYEQWLKRATASHRNWHLKLGVAGVYDDNVVAKPDANIPGLDITNEADVGFVGTFQLDYTPLIPKGWLFTGHYALQTTTYGTIATHNTIQHAVNLMPGREFTGWSLTLPISYNHLLLGEENYLGQTTIRPTVSVAFGDGQILQASGGYSRREMQQPPLDPDENRDGNLFMTGAGYVALFRALPATMSLRYEFTYDRSMGRNWENRGHRVAGSLLVPIGGGVSGNLGVDALFQRYLRPHSTFDVRRDDTLFNASGGLTWNFWDGLALIAQYTYSNAASNIAAYDYQRNQANLGLEFSF